MELQKVLDSRKSVRTYTGEQISNENMNKIIHAANVAPVGMGKYDSIHLTIVKDKDVLDEIEKLTAKAFKVDNRSFLYGAPELVIVSTSAVDNVGYSNAAIIAHNMVLSAVDQGIGACYIWGCMMALQSDPELIKKLGILEGFTPTCAVGLGVTEEEYTVRNIKDDRISVNQI